MSSQGSSDSKTQMPRSTKVNRKTRIHSFAQSKRNTNGETERKIHCQIVKKYYLCRRKSYVGLIKSVL